MNANRIVSLVLLICAAVLAYGSYENLSIAGDEKNPAPPEKNRMEVDANLLAGEPVASAHLTVIPLYVKTPERLEEILTLAEAAEGNSFIISEMNEGQGEVNTLKVQNKTEKPVLILSGEIVFGGKQDRMMAVDTIVPPKKDEEYTLSVYCVEHGRWVKREPPSAAAGQFSAGGRKQLGPQANASSEQPGGAAAGQVPKGTSYDNMANKNMNSNAAVDAYGVGGGAAGAYGQRWGKGMLANEGGSPGTEDAGIAALRWLHFHHESDGRWDADGFSKNCKDAKCDGAATDASPKQDIYTTGMSVLAYLGKGHTHTVGEFKKDVRESLKFLRDCMSEDGAFKIDNSAVDFGSSLPAWTAILEAYAITKDENLKGPSEKILKYILGAQIKDSGWAAAPGTEADVRTTAWAILSLKTARTAGLEIPIDAAVPQAIKFFDSVTGADGRVKMTPSETSADGIPSATAMAIIARIFCGQKRSEEPIKKGEEILINNLPEYDEPGLEKVDYEYWFWGTYSMFQIGGADWKKWNEAAKTALIKHQFRGGCADGSWTNGKRGASGGHAAATALGALSLEIYYRYSRVGAASLAQNRPNTQGDIWSEVSQMNSKLGTNNDTQTYRENLQTNKADDKISPLLGALENTFLADNSICGFACAINGEILYVDLFPSPVLAGKYKYRLLKSYVLEAINRSDKATGVKVGSQDVKDFVLQGNKDDFRKTDKAFGVEYDVRMTGGVVRTDVSIEGKLVRRAYYKLER